MAGAAGRDRRCRSRASPRSPRSSSIRTAGCRRRGRSSGGTRGSATTATAMSRTDPSTSSVEPLTTHQPPASSFAVPRLSRSEASIPGSPRCTARTWISASRSRKHHGRVVYQPRSVVEHVRGASGSGGVQGCSNRAQPPAAARPLAKVARSAPTGELAGRAERHRRRPRRDDLRAGARADGAATRRGRGRAEQRRLHDLVVAAASRWPEARWTVASLDGEPVTQPDDLGDAGIEAVTGAESWDAWLAGRRYHYGIVAVADSRWSEGLLGRRVEGHAASGGAGSSGRFSRSRGTRCRPWAPRIGNSGVGALEFRSRGTGINGGIS